MEEFEILTNVLLSNAKNKKELQEVYILLSNELDNLTEKDKKN